MAKRKTAKPNAVPDVDRKWQAEEDARILRDAQQILRDGGRKSRALAAAKRLASDAQKTASQFNMLGGKRS